MLMKISKKIELVANIAIIVVACLLAVVLVKDLLVAKSPNRAGDPIKPSETIEGPKIKIGNKLAITDTQLPKSSQTLVLGISSSCHFCTDSAAFYKKLSAIKANNRLIAVLPQSVEDGQRYLRKLGISVDEVRQLQLDTIGIEGTPTLILLDDAGVVRNSWVGKLPPEQERVVLEAFSKVGATKPQIPFR